MKSYNDLFTFTQQILLRKKQTKNSPKQNKKIKKTSKHITTSTAAVDPWHLKVEVAD